MKCKLTKEFLETEHLVKNKSLSLIARENGLSAGSMTYFAKCLGVKTRTKAEANKLLGKRIDTQVCALYAEGKTMLETSKLVGCSLAGVHKILKRNAIKSRPSSVVGQKGHVVSEERKKKQSETMKAKFASGHRTWNKGLTNETDERVKNLSEKLSPIRKVIFKGEGNPFYGKKHSDEIKQKLSLSHGGTGIPYENCDYPITWTQELREEIRQRDNYTCQICGTTEEECFLIYGRALDVHHIDYNKQNCEKVNLTSLCQHCHHRTNYNREHWIKFFSDALSERCHDVYNPF